MWSKQQIHVSWWPRDYGAGTSPASLWVHYGGELLGAGRSERIPSVYFDENKSIKILPMVSTLWVIFKTSFPSPEPQLYLIPLLALLSSSVFPPAAPPARHQVPPCVCATTHLTLSLPEPSPAPLSSSLSIPAPSLRLPLSTGHSRLTLLTHTASHVPHGVFLHSLSQTASASSYLESLLPFCLPL